MNSFTRINLLISVIFYLLWGGFHSYADRFDSISSPSHPYLFNGGLDLRGANAFPSFKDDVLQKNLDDSKAVNERFIPSFHIKGGFAYGLDSEMGRLWPGVEQGIGVGLFVPQHYKATGLPMVFYLYQTAPMTLFNTRLSLDYEWDFGLSSGWKPSDGTTAASSLIVGSRVNAFINLGLVLKWRVSKRIALLAGVDLSHFSNGNTSFPNPGVNTVGVRVGITVPLYESSSATPFNTVETTFTRDFSYDLTFYGAWRRRVYRGGEEPVLLNGRFPVAGMSFSPMFDFRRWLRAGVSADFQWDKSSGLEDYHIAGEDTETIRFSKVPFFRQICGGLAARAELVMPIFSVNIGVGYYFFGPQESRASYQMANLKTYLTPGLYLNIGYQLLNFQRQNNLMLSFGYTFKSSRHKDSVLIRRW